MDDPQYVEGFYLPAAIFHDLAARNQREGTGYLPDLVARLMTESLQAKPQPEARTPSFEDVRLMIREEIRAALRDDVNYGSRTGSGGFPLVEHDGGEMLAVDADGRVTWPERLRGARLCTHQTFGHSYDPVRPDGKLAYDGPDVAA